MTLVFCAFMACVSLLMLIPLTLIGSVYLIGAGVAIFGFFITTVGPISFEVSVEIAFPVSEATAGGILITISQFTIIIGVSFEGWKTMCTSLSVFK